MSARKGVFITEKRVFNIETRIPNVGKGVLITEKSVFNPRKGILSIEKGISNVQKGAFTIQKGFLNVRKGILITEKGILNIREGGFISRKSMHFNSEPDKEVFKFISWLKPNSLYLITPRLIAGFIEMERMRL